LAAGPVAAASAPHERMAVRIPVGGRRRDCLPDRGPARKPSSLQGTGAQDRPPRLNQVQVGGVRGLEDELPARMGQREEQHVGGALGAQVVAHRLDALDAWIKPARDVVEKIGPVDGRAAWIGSREGAAGGGLEGATDGPALPPAVVARLACPARRPPGRLAGCGQEHALAGPALGRLRAQLVQTEHHAPCGRARVPRC